MKHSRGIATMFSQFFPLWNLPPKAKAFIHLRNWNVCCGVGVAYFEGDLRIFPFDKILCNLNPPLLLKVVGIVWLEVLVKGFAKSQQSPFSPKPFWNFIQYSFFSVNKIDQKYWIHWSGQHNRQKLGLDPKRMLLHGPKMFNIFGIYTKFVLVHIIYKYWIKGLLFQTNNGASRQNGWPYLYNYWT